MSWGNSSYGKAFTKIERETDVYADKLQRDLKSFFVLECLSNSSRQLARGIGDRVGYLENDQTHMIIDGVTIWLKGPGRAVARLSIGGRTPTTFQMAVRAAAVSLSPMTAR